jgi:hypothetical protein
MGGLAQQSVATELPRARCTHVLLYCLLLVTEDAWIVGVELAVTILPATSCL